MHCHSGWSFCNLFFFLVDFGAYHREDTLLICVPDMALKMRTTMRAQGLEHAHVALLKYFEASATIAVGGEDIDFKLLMNMRRI